MSDPEISATDFSDDKLDYQQQNHEWVSAKTLGRWAPFWNPATRTYAPPASDRRREARRKKYAYSALTMRGGPAYVPLHFCMTGDELLAERKRIAGDGTSFRLPPHTDEARELVALLPHGRLRTVEALILVALTYAMLVRRRHGLVATAAELGEFVGLRVTATSEALARLIALGFVHADATYTHYGKCWSQRGNLLRLTTRAIAAFALCDVPEGITVPAGTVDRARLGRRRRTPTPSPGIATPRNPETIQDTSSNTDDKTRSFRNGPRSALSAASEIVGRTATAGDVRPASTATSCNAGLTAPEGEHSRLAADVRRAQQRAAAAAAEFSPAAFAALVRDPNAREGILDAGRRPRVLDDTELRFSMLEPYGRGGDS